MLRIFLLGAGGFTKQVIDILKMSNINICGIFDDYKQINSLYYYNYRIMDNLNNVHKYINKDDLLFCGIGDNKIRKDIVCNFEMYKFINVISPIANISTTTKIIGTGNYIGHHVNLISDSIIGNHNFMNDGSMIGHDVTISDFNHFCPMAVAGGNVKIGNGNLIGTNSTINPKIIIGNNNTIGSGTVVIRNIDDNNVIVGNPGKIKIKI
jgi:sugar O-acyltransferase (sialic acid O-acetyltransferase NeuD family)